MKLKRGICVAVWVAALCACLLLADRVTRRDDSARKYGPFYEEEQAIDVFLMGTSRMFDGVQPMELWRDYGITSYNLANSSECPEMTEWVLRLALEQHTPKVAVFDVYYINRHIDDAWAYTFRHLFLDSVPLSPLKVKAVTSTLPRDQWLEFLAPFSLYHGRWEELLSGQSVRMIDSEPFMMGSELRIGRERPAEPYVRTQAVDDTPLPGRDALRRLALYCRENGIEPVFLAIPAPVSEQEQMYMNSVQRIADELGAPFLNLFDEEGLIDFETDCYDYLGHLNPDGATKLTACLGAWLSGHMALEDHRGEAGYALWDERLAQYEAYREAVWGEWTRLDAGT